MTHSANALQHIASDPEKVVWVSASAGSGKTTVLSKRLLRLMLPRGNQPASAPERLLCLTFTKTGAGEMKRKLMETLKEWATIPTDKLEKQLEALLQEPPHKTQIEAARGLFAKVLDCAGGLKILTIHAFCLSILQRFPVESGLAPGFGVLDDVLQTTLLTQAFEHASNTHSPLLDPVLAFMSPTTLQERVTDYMKNHDAWGEALKTAGSLEALCANAFALYDVAVGDTPTKLFEALTPFLEPAWLKNFATLLQPSKSTSETFFKFLQALGDAQILPTAFERAAVLNLVWLTASSNRVNGTLKNILVKMAPVEAEQIVTAFNTYHQKVENLEQAYALAGLLRFVGLCVAQYETLKLEHGKLDNTDLVQRTAQVLQNTNAMWVQYKLDSGIDHILVDEAQDTSPTQWSIIKALSDPFFDVQATVTEKQSSFFVVGDDKQSIFSFQDAAPHLFRTLEAETQQKAEAAQYNFSSVPMHISFRSSALVLDLVDATFKHEAAAKGVVPKHGQLKHTAFWGLGGEVELWPVFEQQNKTKLETNIEDPEDHYTIQDKTEPEEVLAQTLVLEIKKWLSQGQKLPGEQRSIKPDDILILVRRRGQLAGRLVRLLKQNNIPVEGMDRLVLGRILAVQDIMAALKFGVQTADNLSLAGLLRSPLVDLSEEEIFTLCHYRASRQTVHEALDAHEKYAACSEWLNGLIKTVRQGSVAQAVSYMLDLPCPQSSVSGLEALTSRLGLDALDPLLLLLERAQAHDSEETSGIQGFIARIEQDETEIKREQDKAKGMVRVMTVHGSKGLEAPIVILPDTLRSTGNENETGDKLIWPEDPNMPPFIKPPKTVRTAAITTALEALNETQEEEYNRLLYVALTRASHKLLVCGAWGSTHKQANNTWYSAISKGVEALQAANMYQPVFEPMPAQLEDFLPPSAAKIILRREATQQKPAKDNAEQHITAERTAWMYSKAPPAPKTLKPLAPSRAFQGEPAALSPLLGAQNNRFKRGLILHSLLQYLPSVPHASRTKKALAYLAQLDLQAYEQAEIWQTAQNVLQKPDMQDLFGPNSRAEVPLTGKVGDVIVSGQIDRLVVTPENVVVLDYKTNRPAPLEAPEAYIQQMALYRQLLAQIYPDRAIKTYLLWTDGVRLQEVS